MTDAQKQAIKENLATVLTAVTNPVIIGIGVGLLVGYLF